MYDGNDLVSSSLAGDTTPQKRYDAMLTECLPWNLAWKNQAFIDQRFEMGDQNVYVEQYGANSNYSQPVHQNIIRPAVEMIAGTESQRRTGVKYTAERAYSQTTADEFTTILMNLNAKTKWLSLASDIFKHGALVAGIGLMHVYLDFSRDPINGDIKFEYVPFSAMAHDPFFRKKDLSDCRYISKRTWCSPEEIYALFPFLEGENIQNTGTALATGNFMFMPENFAFPRLKLSAVDEMYYLTYRDQLLLVDQMTLESFEWTGPQDERLQFFLSNNRHIEPLYQKIPTVRQIIAINKKVVVDQPQPSGLDCYPFSAFLGHFYPDSNDFSYRIQGVVRGLRDVNYLINQNLTKILKQTDTQINSGVIYKPEALYDQDDAFKANEGQTVAVRPEFPLGEAMQKIPSGHVDDSYFTLQDKLMNLPFRILGIAPEAVGAGGEDLAGIQEILRQRASQVVLQGFMNNVEDAKLQVAEIVQSMVQVNYGPGKVANILGREPSKPFYSRVFEKYGCVTELSPNTATQQQLAFSQALQLKVKAGAPISWDYLLKRSSLPDKEELLKSMAEQEQMQAQMQQQQQQLQMAELEANIEMAKARATADKGLGIERVSRVKENQALAVERRAEAIKDEQEALLAMAKAFKELQSVDIDNAKRMLEIAEMFNRKKAEEIERAQQVQPQPNM